MPIAGAINALQVQIKNSLSLDMAATPELFALSITNALTSIVPSGQMPSPSGPLPLIPAGFAAMQAQAKNAASLDMAATPDTAAEVLTTAIIALVPMVPPVAQAVLKIQIKNAFSLDTAATPDSVATVLANAIISYYTAAGVV